jgi:hypothetical protein
MRGVGGRGGGGRGRGEGLRKRKRERELFAGNLIKKDVWYRGNMASIGMLPHTRGSSNGEGGGGEEKWGEGDPCSARIFKQSTGTRERVGIGLSYRPAGLHRLAA